MDGIEVPAERPWACVPGAGVPGRALGHPGTVHHEGWASGAGAGSWKPAGSQGLGGEGQSRQNGSAEKNNSCSNLEKSHRTQFHLGGPGLCATQTVCCPRLHLTPRARGPAFPPATAREGPHPPSPAGQRASHTAWHPSSVTRCPPSPCPAPPTPEPCLVQFMPTLLILASRSPNLNSSGISLSSSTANQPPGCHGELLASGITDGIFLLCPHLGQ